MVTFLTTRGLFSHLFFGWSQNCGAGTVVGAVTRRKGCQNGETGEAAGRVLGGGEWDPLVPFINIADLWLNYYKLFAHFLIWSPSTFINLSGFFTILFLSQ